MMRGAVFFAILGAAQAALVAPDAKASPLVAKKVKGHVTLSVEQQKTMHSGCVSACRPSPVESKCVTACEAAMYKCIDETGPNETPADTKKCQDGVLKKFQETKGIEKKEEKDGAPSPAPAPAKAKMFLQLAARDDEDFGDDTSDGEEDFASETMDDEQDDTEQSDEEEASDDESASSDEDEAAEDEEAAKETEGTDEGAMEDAQEEATAGEDEEQEEAEGVDEDAMDEEEESFVQTSNTIAVGDVSAGDAVSDDSGVADAAGVVASDTASDDAGAAAADAAGVAATDAAADVSEAADAPAIGDMTNDEAESFIETGSSWKPEADSSIKLYEHPQGSTFVTPCPVTSLGNPEACTAYFGGKADGDKCPQITCPKALGVTMKLTCGGGCCPTCWAPDHVIAVDRHTSVDDAAVVDPAPQAPGTCGGVKCFKLKCAPGFTEGHVNGACCYSCVQGR